MNFKDLKEKRWFKIISNKYFILIGGFTVWMFFFDSNSYLVHRELDQELNKLKSNQNYYEEEIEKDGAEIEQLIDEEGLEKYGREKYFMKKEDEDVFIIEYKDSTEQKK